MTIFLSKYNVTVNEQFTVYGRLYDRVTYAPIPNQKVTLTVQSPLPLTYTDYTVTTDTNGDYTLTISEASQGTYPVYADFNNLSSGYNHVQAMTGVTVGNPLPVKITLTATPANPAPGQTFKLSGRVTDKDGVPFANLPLYIDCQEPNELWQFRAHITTDANGYYSWSYAEQQQGQYYYEVMFWGNGAYNTACTVVELPVGNLTATTLTMNKDIANPAPNQTFHLSGKLADSNGKAIVGGRIDLYNSVVSNIIYTTYTGANGAYSFPISEPQGYYRYFTAEYIGDQTHLCSFASVNDITIGTLVPATVTIVASNYALTSGQAFALSGKLTAGGVGLAGETIYIMRFSPSGTWNEGGKTTTDANGAYSISLSEKQTGDYYYYAAFMGDLSHGYTSCSGIHVVVN